MGQAWPRDVVVVPGLGQLLRLQFNSIQFNSNSTTAQTGDVRYRVVLLVEHYREVLDMPPESARTLSMVRDMAVGKSVASFWEPP